MNSPPVPVQYIIITEGGSEDPKIFELYTLGRYSKYSICITQDSVSYRGTMWPSESPRQVQAFVSNARDAQTGHLPSVTVEIGSRSEGSIFRVLYLGVTQLLRNRNVGFAYCCPRGKSRPRHSTSTLQGGLIRVLFVRMNIVNVERQMKPA